MKKIIFILAIIFIMMPTLSFGQDTTTISENIKKEKKNSYSFITEHGLYLGWDIGYTGVFVNGICFNKTQDLIGIGVGAEYGISELGIPIYANYRHYFSKKWKMEPLINVAIGSRLTCIAGTWYPDFYSTVAAGFCKKGFSFISGFYVKSIHGGFYSGIEIKLGYIFKHNKKTDR